MPVLVVGEEKNFAALRPRLFAQRVSNVVAGHVADAIREANPGVDLDALRPGMVLSIPSLHEIALGETLALDERAAGAMGSLEETIRGAVGTVLETATMIEREDASARRDIAKLVRSRELIAAAREDADLAAVVDGLGRVLELEDAAAKQRTALREQAQSDWTGAIHMLHTVLP